jgi:glyoxylase-like metal-dependent hydrolase (beta-lactamase superfamily II)
MTPARVAFRLLKVGHCRHPECVAQRGGRLTSVMFPALVGLLTLPGGGVMLFDTGYSEHFFEATRPFPERLYRWTTPVTLAPGEQLLAQLAALGIGAADVSHVMISHFHGDHIAGMRDFPRARFIAARAGHDALRQRSRVGGLLQGFLPALIPDDFAQRVDHVEERPLRPLPAELRPFEQGYDLFGDGSVLAVPLPGHARGQLGIVFRRHDERLLFMVADACWSAAALDKDQPPTWLASRIFDSRSIYQRTFAQLRQAAAHPEAATLVPSHCETTWRHLSDEST